MRTWSTPGTALQKRMKSSTSPAVALQANHLHHHLHPGAALLLHPAEAHEIVPHFLEPRALPVELEALLRSAVEAQRDVLEWLTAAAGRMSPRPAACRWSKAASRCGAARSTRSARRSSGPETARPARSASCARRSARSRAPAARRSPPPCLPWAAGGSRAGTSGSTGCTWPWSRRCTPPATHSACCAAAGSPREVSDDWRAAIHLL